MFPEIAAPPAGNGYATSAINQQNNSLLGNQQVQSTGMPLDSPISTNTTAPLSSINPHVANMVQALKGAGS